MSHLSWKPLTIRATAWILLSMTITGCVEAPPLRQVIVRESLPASQAPPPPPMEVRMQPPSAQYVWASGHWIWRNGWVWRPGQWLLRPGPSAQWVAGHWARGATGWIWLPGHWASSMSG